MALIFTIDVIVVFTLVSIAKRRGLENALPFFVFILTLIPGECRLVVPGLFDLYTRRLALIVLAYLFFAKSKKRVTQALPLKNLLLAHAGWVVLSTLTSIVVLTSSKQILAQVIEYYLTYYIILKTVTDVRTISRITFAMVAAMGVACVFGLLEIYAGWSVLSIFPAELQETYGSGSTLYAELLNRGIRARSTFPHPILFGGAISMMIPLTMYLLTTIASRFQKVFLCICLLLMFWNVYKTTSRGPWLATGLSMAVLLVTAKAKIRKQILATSAIAVLVLVLRPGVLETILNTYVATLDTNTYEGMSFAYRPALLRAVRKALDADSLRALLGFGLGSFREKGLIVVLPNVETHVWYTCDSAWLLLAYETGYVGLLLVAALLFKPARMAIQAYRKLPKADGYFCVACVSSLVSFYVVMISVAVYGWGQNGNMLWTVIAITVSYIVLKKRQSAPKPPVAPEPISEFVVV